MSDRPKKSSPALTSRNVEEQARLHQIRKLWSQLARLRANSAEHRELVQKIRNEANEFRKLTEKSSGEQ
jgi:predicted  nucleic acid-binding Zn-ribbon protein